MKNVKYIGMGKLFLQIHVNLLTDEQISGIDCRIQKQVHIVTYLTVV